MVEGVYVCPLTRGSEEQRRLLGLPIKDDSFFADPGEQIRPPLRTLKSGLREIGELPGDVAPSRGSAWASA